MGDNVSFMTKIILDNSILIDLNFGTKKQKDHINKILKKHIKKKFYITKITKGEFIRSAIYTFIRIINEILTEIERIKQYDSFEVFLDDIAIDIPSFSLHEKDRILKIMKLIKKRVSKFYEVYQKNNISFDIALESIIFDLINFNNLFLSNIILLDNSYICNDNDNSIRYNKQKENKLIFNNPISCQNNNCKREVLLHFFSKYKNEINLVDTSIKEKRIKNDRNFIESFQILKDIQNIESIDGRKHYCYKLVDYFIILETPIDYFIFTTNLKHFEPISRVLNKTLLI